jgi:hypothetical protein
VETGRRWASRIGVLIPENLTIFIAAIFLSNGVNVFTTIYAVPGKPVRSFGLWCSCISSVLAAGLWTALAAKKGLIDKAALSGASDLEMREEKRAQMWRDVWLQTLAYLGGAVAFSILAMGVLVIPE